jgi:hypothetical protein
MSSELSVGSNVAQSCGVQRRTVLRAATGLLLATTRLLLPGAAGETDARSGSNNGNLGGRRGKNRRGQHRRRTHGNRKHRNRPNAPKAIIRGIEWQVHSQNRTLDVQFWTVKRDWVIQESVQVAAGGQCTFRTSWTEGVLWINGKYFISGENPIATPRVTVGHGGTMTKHFWEDGTFVLDRYEVKENNAAPTQTMDGIAFEISRQSDDDDYKRFILRVA